MMEDAVRDTARNSFHKLISFVDSFIPKKVEINSIYDVKNHYADGSIVASG